MNLFGKITTAWNILKFRRAGVRFGHRLRVSGRVGLYNRGRISIGDGFVCTSGTMANAMGRNMRSFIKVVEGAELSIGDNTGMSSATIRCAERITIGSNVKIGALVIITDTDAHSLDYVQRRSPETDAPNARTRPIEIGDDVFIGVGSIICKGVHIGPRSIIGAGSVVTRSVPADEVWAGNPACFVKSLKQE